MTARSLWPAILAGWALAATVLLVALFHMVVRQGFHDPDDAMRLLEVRDWLGGQSFWDVSQHRLGGGAAFQMHWSRIVDLPLAAVIRMSTPIFGEPVAERVAMVVVPLALLLAVMALLAHVTRQVAEVETARTALLIVPVTAPLLAQLQPMRIDHHGWQVALSVAAVASLLARATVTSGALAGFFAAALVSVSIEGLPFTATMMGVAAVAWAFDPSRGSQIRAFGWALAGGAVLLQILSRGPGWSMAACDAVSPAWLGVFIAGAAGLTCVTLRPAGNLYLRLLALTVPATAAAATLLLAAPDCARGPFAALDPLTREIWFNHVEEGLPIWRQRLAPAAITFALPVVGLFGAVFAANKVAHEARRAWHILIALQIAAMLLALLVLRAGATANALAVPGAAVLVTALLARARAVPRLLPRIGATIPALSVAAPGAIAAILLLLPGKAAAPGSARSSGRPPCTSATEVAALARLPSSRLFAPLDISPEILTRTSHSAIASGYHRNVSAMHDVIAAFVGSPEAARAIMKRRGARYVVGCPGLDEPEYYKKVSPHGFWARLEGGSRFPWLEPVPMPNSPVLAWRITD